MPDYICEQDLRARGLWPIAGVDEVGRGPLAGPVMAAAVILDPTDLPLGLDDSKKLSAKKREALFYEITTKALAISIASASAEEIDAINIRQATHLAMRRALNALALKPAYVLVDGNDLPRDLPCPGETLVKGDARSLSIAAASIIAKVTRDRLMANYARHYPAYGFECHAGYGTKAHLAAIKAHGPCPLHRLSFATFRPAHD